MPDIEFTPESVGLVRLKPSGSPAKFEAAIRKASPELVGSLVSWVHEDWFALSSEVASAFAKLDEAAVKASGASDFKIVPSASFEDIASLRDPQAGRTSFVLRDRADLEALPPVTVDPPTFSWSGSYQGQPVQIDWHVAAIGLPQVWEALVPAGPSAYAGIKVGHIDTGYTEHPALGFGSAAGTWLLPANGKNFWKEKVSAFPIGEGPDRWSSRPEFDGPRDNLSGAHGGHGTRTGSVMAGLFAPPGPPIAFPFFGAAPGAPVIPYRIADTVLVDHVPDLLAAAIDHAVAQGAAVISISMGALRRSKRVAAAIERAYRQGVIVCAAAGQIFRSVIYPGAFNCVITVGGATTADGRDFHPWSLAARGPEVDISGPADRIRRATTVLSGGQTKFRISGPGDGTSFATALCAGIAVLWLAQHTAALDTLYGSERWARVEAFRHLLKSTALVPAGWPTASYGAGVYQAHALMEAPLPALATLVQVSDAA